MGVRDRGDPRGVPDLDGKKVGIHAAGSPDHLFLSVIVANVRIDPKAQIDWVTRGPVRAKQLFIDGKIDAFLGFPPEPQELRARGIGRVVVNSAVDRPWSQYFCCMLAGNTDDVENHPVATKRVVRAILKAADLCASEPARAARMLVDQGFTPATTMRCRRSRRSRKTSGANTTPRTRCASTRCACTS